MQAHDPEVLVIGAGPAGSAAAARLARAGHDVLIVEAEAFPRFHIGESLLPFSEPVFAELGLTERIAAAGFVTKYGAQLISPDGSKNVLFDFSINGRNMPTQTFQVQRAQFDQLVLEHAQACGARLLHARVTDWREDADAVTVQVTRPDGTTTTLRPRALIDASGRAGVVARRAGVRVVDQQLRKAAVYAHYRNVPVDAGRRGGDTRVLSTAELGWFWLIPLAGDVMSVGVVLDLEDYQRRNPGNPERLLADAIARTPVAARLLRAAERISDVHVESGFSYRATTYHGRRWVLAGDAGSFLDPVFSTGVLMALRGGHEAADAVRQGILGTRGERALARYDRVQQRRYWFVRRFVTGFYDPHTRDMFFSPRPYLGLQAAVTRVLSGGFDPGFLDRLRLQVFFLLGRLQSRFQLVDRVHGGTRPDTEMTPAGGRS